MKKLPVIIAAASTLCVFPALGQTGSQPPIGMNRDLGGTKGGLGSSLGEHKSYGYEREGGIRRGGAGARGQAMQEGCKYITVRQRQGDTVTIRRFKRCD
jgi:hypothetical protein